MEGLIDIRQTLKWVVVSSFFGLLCIAGYILFRRQQLLEQKFYVANEPLTVEFPVPQPSQSVVEKIVPVSQVWRPVQEQVKDTVVQIFSQIAEEDILQPYKTPSQGTAYGSGFFINKDGDFVTNAHVIDQAKAVWIQIPSLGKQILDATLIGVSPERDIALLRVSEKGLKTIREQLGSVPFLPLGDSDLVRRSDEVLALGYPLGQQSLKSTTGVVSGREQHLLQTSAPINPGNSGGPLVNVKGEVVGINEANVPSAQNVGYAIPVNDLKIVLPDLYKVKLLRKPFLGVLFNNGTNALTEYLGNPHPGGCYVVEVVKGSTLEKAGVKSGDMIYQLNGHKVDIYGEMTVPWNEDKISLVDYVSRLSIGQDIKLVIYRMGTKKEFNVKFTNVELPAIRKIYPGFEEIDYEVFAGMVVTPLTMNHIQLLVKQAPGLAKYAELHKQADPVLIISHIFPNSQLYRSRTLTVGTVITEINGIPVNNMDDYRKAIRESTKSKFLTIRASDNVVRASDNVLVALPFKEIIREEVRLSCDFKYPLSETAKDILQAAQAQKLLKQKEQVA